jgi:hypothetical protein
MTDDGERPWNWFVRPKRSDQVTIRMDLYEQQMAERRAERRRRRELDPYRLGIWGPIDDE